MKKIFLNGFSLGYLDVPLLHHFCTGFVEKTEEDLELGPFSLPAGAELGLKNFLFLIIFYKAWFFYLPNCIAT